MCYQAVFVLACGHPSNEIIGAFTECREVKRGVLCDNTEIETIEIDDKICMSCREAEDHALFVGDGVQKYPGVEGTEYTERARTPKPSLSEASSSAASSEASSHTFCASSDDGEEEE